MLSEFYQKHHDCQYQFNPIPEQENPGRWMSENKIPYLPLLIDGPWADILEEVKKLDDLFVEHRSSGQHQGWSSLCLHGLGYNKTDTPVMYPEFKDIPENKLPWRWTEISERCPVATEYFKNVFPYKKYQRLRFMRLAPGGYITPHADGVNFMLGAVNISLNNPIGCKMVLEDVGVVPFQDTGSVIAFNTSYQHMVWNRSDITRYHMIVHGIPDYQVWNNIILDSYRAQLIS
jgi:hypothetical protein